MSFVEIFHLDGDSLRVKSKKSTVIVDPTSSISKTPADAVLATKYQEETADKVVDSRMLINAPGEYEVGGLKVTGLRDGDSVSFNLNVDDIDTIIAKNSSLSKTADRFEGCEVLLLNVDSDLNQSVVTALEPSVLILYGVKAKEGAKTMGKEVSPTNKFSVNKDKLPEEMELVLLG